LGKRNLTSSRSNVDGCSPQGFAGERRIRRNAVITSNVFRFRQEVLEKKKSIPVFLGFGRSMWREGKNRVVKHNWELHPIYTTHGSLRRVLGKRDGKGGISWFFVPKGGGISIRGSGIWRHPVCFQKGKHFEKGEGGV